MPSKVAKETNAKTVGEVKYFNFDFALDMESGAAINGATATATPTGLTVASATYSGQEAQTKLSSGTAGVSYLVKMQVTTDAGETLEAFGWLAVTAS